MTFVDLLNTIRTLKEARAPLRAQLLENRRYYNNHWLKRIYDYGDYPWQAEEYIRRGTSELSELDATFNELYDQWSGLFIDLNNFPLLNVLINHIHELPNPSLRTAVLNCNTTQSALSGMPLPYQYLNQLARKLQKLDEATRKDIIDECRQVEQSGDDHHELTKAYRYNRYMYC